MTHLPQGWLIHYRLPWKTQLSKGFMFSFILWLPSLFYLFMEFWLLFPLPESLVHQGGWALDFKIFFSRNTQKYTPWKQDFILVAKLKEICKQWLNKYSSNNLWSSGATQMNVLSILNIWKILTERTTTNAERAPCWRSLPPVPCAHIFPTELPKRLSPSKMLTKVY